MDGHGIEPALAIPTQPEPAAAVVSAGFRFRGKEILAEENVFGAITVDVTDREGERGRQLCRQGEWARFEALPAVQEEGGLKPVGLEYAWSFGAVFENLSDASLGELPKGFEARNEVGEGGRDTAPVLIGDVSAHRRFVMGFEQVDAAGAVEVAVVEAQGLIAMPFVSGILAPVRGEDIHASIAVHIAGGDAVPPASEWFHTECFGDLEVTAARVAAKDPERAPVAGQDEFGDGVAVEVAENGAADHSEAGPEVTVHGIFHEAPLLIEEQLR